jgi:hypothetical protein
VLARRMAGEPLPTVPTELFVMTCLFAIAVLASIYGCMRLAGAFRMPAIAGFTFGEARQQGTAQSAGSPRTPTAAAPEGERSRAAAVASLLTSINRRERDGLAHPSAAAAGSWQGRVPEMRTVTAEGPRQSTPLGKSFSRRPGARVSALAGKRDASA